MGRKKQIDTSMSSVLTKTAPTMARSEPTTRSLAPVPMGNSKHNFCNAKYVGAGFLRVVALPCLI